VSAWARPGVKCVCIKRDQWKNLQQGEVPPRFGQELTIRSVELVDGILGLMFVEIVNQPQKYDEGFSECCWDVLNFRPLITRTQEQDVALFRKIVADAPAGVDA
jgi:hypothetical protein